MVILLFSTLYSLMTLAIADPGVGGGFAPGAPPPPLTTADLRFFMPITLHFLSFSLPSLAI